jgi:hypothetical protein
MAVPERIERHEDRTDKERAKALEIAVSQIEKQFGKGSIMRLGGKDTIGPSRSSPRARLAWTGRSAWAVSPAAA